MKKNNPSIAEFVLNKIFHLGVEYVFLVPGAQIMPLVQALYERGNLEVPAPIIGTHELAAGFMAIGYSRVSGKAGVALSIGGPGAAYMVGAGICAKADDVPLIQITGNIPLDRYGKGEFQDASHSGTNDVAMYRAAVSNSVVCNSQDDLQQVIFKLHEAVNDLKPLHIQIPVNVMREEVVSTVNDEQFTQKSAESYALERLLPRTVLLLGRKASECIDPSVLSEFVLKNSIPIVTDIKSRGVISETEPVSLGCIGFNSDIRALSVLNYNSAFAAEKIIVSGIKPAMIEQYIDISRTKVVNIEPGLINEFLKTTASQVLDIEARKQWIFELNRNKKPFKVVKRFKDRVSYFDLIEVLNRQAPEDVVFTLDSGQIRRAGSMFLTCKSPQMIIQSDSLSPMGSGICASIGAQLANQKKRVIALFGDGSMRMHGMELVTAVRYDLPVIFILCDNQSYASTSKLHKDAKILTYINWKTYADSIGLNSFFADNKDDFSEAFEKCLSQKRPAMIWTLVPYLLEDEIQTIEELESRNWLSEI